jgi:hypothetical protein
MIGRKVLRQENYPTGRKVKNIKTGKIFRVTAIGTKTAVKIGRGGNMRFVSAKNLRVLK